MNKIGRVLSVVSATAGAWALTITPSAAAPDWQPWVKPKLSKCSPTTHSTVSTKVIHQTCLVASGSSAGQEQGVLLVRNNASVNIKIDQGRVIWHDENGNYLGSAQCYEKIVKPGELTACYGETRHTSKGWKVFGDYAYNGAMNRTASVEAPILY
ncbi:hypothetical protein [Streptomyces sp. bgisy126]|uniref:hypothetical protein n=1 Tax=unclassified Streptomyces TaxID=2593676 RepID=UPI003EBB4178